MKTICSKGWKAAARCAALVIGLTLGAASCRGESPGTGELLGSTIQGNWQIRARKSGIPGLLGKRIAFGVALVGIREGGCRPPRCRFVAYGHTTSTVKTFLRRGPLTPEVEVAVLPNNKVIFRVGGCCDSGEIVGVGIYNGSEIRGTWEQQLLGKAPYGTFEMHRDKP